MAASVGDGYFEEVGEGRDWFADTQPSSDKSSCGPGLVEPRCLKLHLLYVFGEENITRDALSHIPSH